MAKHIVHLHSSEEDKVPGANQLSAGEIAVNNYADLSFINNDTYINVKACRIKTFNAIPMDGNILTYAKNTISDSNFIVFYLELCFWLFFISKDNFILY